MSTLLLAITMVIAAVLLPALVRFVRKWVAWIKLANSFPYEKQWGFMKGTFHEVGGKDWMTLFISVTDKWADNFRDVYVTFLGPKLQTAVSIVHPEPAQAILRTADGKAHSYEFVRPWLGDGLLLSKGKKWQRNRKLLTPAFHFENLKTYLDVYNSSTDVLLEKLAHAHESGRSCDNIDRWDALSDLNLLSLDIITRCAFSYQSNCQTEENNVYAQAISKLNELVVQRSIGSNPLMRADFIYAFSENGKLAKALQEVVHGETRFIIQKRKQELADTDHSLTVNEGHSTRMLDFLDVLLTSKDEDGNGLSDNDIRDEVDTFLFEGHDTTSCGLAWTLYHMATHTEFQLRARKEIDELLSERSTNQVTWDDLSRLKFLTLCIKESLRLTPPVPYVGRRLEKDTVLAGKMVPADSEIDVRIYSIHHNRHYWGDDVEEFKPDRFSAENSEKLHPYAFVPFSAGPRNCIGQNFAMNEMKVVLSKILRRYTVTLSRGAPKPRPALLMTLKHVPDYPILLQLEPRV